MQQCSNEQVEKIVELFKLMMKNFREESAEKFKKYGFTVTQMSLMFALYHCPYIMLNELSGKMGLSKSTVSDMVERLEIQGIVVREIPRDNRRTVRLSLSPEFISRHKELLDFKNNFINDMFKLHNASFEDAEKIIYAMEKLILLMTGGIEKSNCVKE